MAYIDTSTKSPGFKKWISEFLLNSMAGTTKDGKQVNPVEYFSEANKGTLENNLVKGVASGKMTKDAATAFGDVYSKDFKAAQPFIGEGADPGFGDYMGLTGRFISNNPGKAIGLGVLGAGNIGGLTDNDKFGGQLGGLALGGLGSYMMKANPYMAAMMTLGGGELGALFDKLRSKKEQQPQQSQQPYYGGR